MATYHLTIHDLRHVVQHLELSSSSASASCAPGSTAYEDLETDFTDHRAEDSRSRASSLGPSKMAGEMVSASREGDADRQRQRRCFCEMPDAQSWDSSGRMKRTWIGPPTALYAVNAVTGRLSCSVRTLRPEVRLYEAHVELACSDGDKHDSITTLGAVRWTFTTSGVNGVRCNEDPADSEPAPSAYAGVMGVQRSMSTCHLNIEYQDWDQVVRNVRGYHL
nr:hypothetical protein CFP56_34859 [Quercus suber]